MLTTIVIFVFCCVITGIYMWVVKEQLDQAEESDKGQGH